MADTDPFLFDAIGVGNANCKVNRLALLLCGLGDQGKPIVGIGFRVREGNAKGSVVNVTVVETLDEGVLVR